MTQSVDLDTLLAVVLTTTLGGPFAFQWAANAGWAGVAARRA